MPMERSREVRLVSYPEGLPTENNFVIAASNLDSLGNGEVQVKNSWMSVDPYMRGQMHGKDTYVPGFKIGQPLFGGAIGLVTKSRNPRFREGETVLSHLGWREAFNALPDQLTKVDATRLPPQTYLGAAGLTGLSAYAGILKVADVKSHDVVFVSGAAGAVGSVACQLAKLRGAFVIGSAGGPTKCEFLREIGVDAVIDYKSTANLTGALREAAPDGLDVFFDNIGAEHFNAAVAVAKPHARFALCGRISTYNDPGQPLPDLKAGKSKRLHIKQFLVTDYFPLMPSFILEMAEWIHSGKILTRETVENGLDRAVPAFLMLFTGGNVGKMLVRLPNDPS